jgi:hypothetical protein
MGTLKTANFSKRLKRPYSSLHKRRFHKTSGLRLHPEFLSSMIKMINLKNKSIISMGHASDSV